MMQTFAYLAQIVVAVALIASVISVAYQLKISGRLFRIQQRNTRIMGLESYKKLSFDPEFADFLIRARQDYHSLSPQEKLRIEHYYELAMPAIVSIYLFANISSVTAQDSRDFAEQNMKALMDTPGGRQWWQGRRDKAVVGGPAKEIIDRLIGRDGQKGQPDRAVLAESA